MIVFEHRPDQAVGKREFRRMREAQNANGNIAAELLEACKIAVNSECLPKRVDLILIAAIAKAEGK